MSHGRFSVLLASPYFRQALEARGWRIPETQGEHNPLKEKSMDKDLEKVGQDIEASGKAIRDLAKTGQGSAEPFVLRAADGRIVPLGSGRPVGSPSFIHSQGEKPYSVARLMLALAEKNPEIAPMEYSISKKLEAAGYAPSFGGVWVPLGGDELWRTPGFEAHMDALALEIKQAFPRFEVDPEEIAWIQRRFSLKAMDPLDDTAGGSLIPLPAQGPLIEAMRAQAVFSRAGATQVPLPPQGAIHFPREMGDPTFAWLAPNAQISDSTPTTGGITLSPKRAGGLVKLPNDLLRFASPAAEGLVRTGLAQRGALTEDLAFLEGAGATLTPLGLLNYNRSTAETPTADKVTLHVAGTVGNDGNTFTPEDVLKMMGLIEEAPDPQGPNAWVMRPTMFVGLANLRSGTGAGAGTGPFLFPVTRGALGGAVSKELSGLPVLTSTQVSKTRAKGTASNLTYILTGNFRRFYIGRVGAIELAASTERGFELDQTWIRAILRVDGAATRPEAFCVCATLVIP